MSRRRKKLPVPRKPAPGDTLGALRPFAEVELPTDSNCVHVWLYVGEAGGENWVHGAGGTNVPSHLTLEDFRRARRAVGLHAGGEHEAS